MAAAGAGSTAPGSNTRHTRSVHAAATAAPAMTSLGYSAKSTTGVVPTRVTVMIAAPNLVTIALQLGLDHGHEARTADRGDQSNVL